MKQLTQKELKELKGGWLFTSIKLSIGGTK